ncbi:hypothetical protein BDF19DRAFT_432837 [Syncephalis fuscata]|nr:hypothetical protein BDF19DRAFT_432837 [Syncephalis fuscata]
MANSTAPQTTAKGRRTRALLKSYYGLSDHNAADPLDIGGTSFEPNLYTKKLIQERSTPQLLVRHNELITEVRQLDSDMKSLVYENYDKFISATDTMRQMKSRLMSMKEQLGELNQRVERASRSDKLVSGDLAEDQSRILTLDKEHHTLNELGVLFELPSLLLSHLAHDELAAAVKAFRQAAPLLEQFHNEPGYEGIESESREIMAKVAQQLQKNLHNDRADCSFIADATGLLIGTESVDMDQLRQQFVTRTTWRLNQVCERLSEVTTRKGSYLDRQGATLVMDAMSSIHTTLVAELNLAVSCYEECFLSTEAAASPQAPNEEHPTWYRMARPADITVTGALQEWTAPIIQKYTDLVRQVLSLPEDIISLDAAKAASVVDLLFEQLKKATVLVRCTSIEARVQLLVLDWFKLLVDQLFGYPHNQLVNAMKKACEINDKEPGNAFDAVVAYETLLMENLVDRILPLLATLMNQSEIWRHQLEKSSPLVSIIQASTRRFWMSLLDEFLLLSRSRQLTYVHTHTLIIAANLCMDFEAATVESVYDNFCKQLSPEFSSDDFDRWWDQGGNGPDVLSNNPIHVWRRESQQVISRCKAASNELINRYVALSGQRLASGLSTVFELKDWRITSTSAQHSPFWDVMLADWKRACTDVRLLLGDDDEDEDDEEGGNNVASPQKGKEKDQHTVLSEREGDRMERASIRSTRTSRTRFSSLSGGHASARGSRNMMGQSPLMKSATNRQNRLSTAPEPLWMNQTANTGHLWLKDVGKLFVQKIQVLGNVPIDCRTIQVAILRVALKAYAELARIPAYSAEGQAQMELDVQYVAQNIKESIGEENTLIQLLNEAIGAVHRRCLQHLG